MEDLKNAVETEPNTMVLGLNLGPDKFPQMHVGLPEDMVAALASGDVDRAKLRWLVEQTVEQLARFIEREYGGKADIFGEGS